MHAKAVDSDNIHPCILDHLGIAANEILLSIYNHSLVNDSWVWDTSEVIFIRKAGKKSYSSSGSYRPLPLHHTLAKYMIE